MTSCYFRPLVSPRRIPSFYLLRPLYHTPLRLPVSARFKSYFATTVDARDNASSKRVFCNPAIERAALVFDSGALGVRAEDKRFHGRVHGAIFTVLTVWEG
jgi:hypothetical protein